jgi:cardiolipin synthase
MIRRLLKKLLKKQFITAVLILIQLAALIFLFYSISNYRFYLYVGLVFLSFMVVLYVINRSDNPSYKLSWSILILSIPFVGGVLYLILGGKRIPKEFRKEMVKSTNKNLPYLVQDYYLMDKIAVIDEQLVKQSHFLYKNAYFPVYENTDTHFLENGEAKFEAMKIELRKAKHYIFLEYFIIKEGVMWNSIYAILKEKAAEGVEVRLIFDDFGSIDLPHDFAKENNKVGIKTIVFNPMRPRLAIFMNNRNHRKICVIDGNVGFVGGVNIGDEYINVITRFGHWKDSAVMIEGEAVWSLTVMFLTFYSTITKHEEDLLSYKPIYIKRENDGYVQPYADSPTDDVMVGETAHLNLINYAKNYVYIQTPYLVIDYTMVTALVNAAKNGVDVRIMLPYIPDKWYVQSVSRSNYEVLAKAGVKIYEYKPGFIHSKTMVADDVAAIIGTINMDYRSYYMHFECGILFIKSKAVLQVRDDFLATQQECVEITLEQVQNTNVFVKMMRAVLNIFSSLL